MLEMILLCELFICLSFKVGPIIKGPEGVKWELGFAYFWVGKWDWDSSAKKQ
jgi:hypothetical protein